MRLMLEVLKKVEKRGVIETARRLRQICGQITRCSMPCIAWVTSYHSGATVHGFRAMASTALNEMGFRPDVIERQLAHQEQNAVRAAYNRAEYLTERRMMMNQWADYIDAVGGRNVVLLQSKARGE